VNRIFDVSESEVSWARAVLSEAEVAERAGRGALKVAGSLVDAAHVRRARAVLELHDNHEARDAGA
jgi:citrate lyase beta subunit